MFQFCVFKMSKRPRPRPTLKVHASVGADIPATLNFFLGTDIVRVQREDRALFYADLRGTRPRVAVAVSPSPRAGATCCVKSRAVKQCECDSHKLARAALPREVLDVQCGRVSEEALHCYVILRHIDGDDMLALHEGGKLPRWSQCALYLRDIALQVAALHSADLAHCDLRLENFMIDKYERGASRGRVVDFGCVQRIGKRMRCTRRAYYDVASVQCDLEAMGVAIGKLAFGVEPPGKRVAVREMSDAEREQHVRQWHAMATCAKLSVAAVLSIFSHATMKDLARAMEDIATA